jgi:hypothetical protein
MTTLTPLQVAAAAYLGGFRGDEIQQAVQVAFAESSWDTNAQNPCCKGLWQINLKAHPEAVNGDWKDPVHNAYNAHNIFVAAGSNWCRTGRPPNCNPWAGYGTSAYNKAYGQAHMALAQLRQQMQGKDEKAVAKGILGNLTKDTSPGTPDAVAGTLDAVQNNFIPGVLEIGKFFSALTQGSTWIRIAEGALGVMLLGLGIAAITKGTPIGSAIRSTPIGKVAKVLK